MSDSADQFIISCNITSANAEVSDDSPVTVKAKVIRMSTNSEVTSTEMSGATWRMDVMDKDAWTTIKSANSDTITISSADMGQRDSVEVVAEASWN